MAPALLTTLVGRGRSLQGCAARWALLWGPWPLASCLFHRQDRVSSTRRDQLMALTCRHAEGLGAGPDSGQRVSACPWGPTCVVVTGLARGRELAGLGWGTPARRGAQV